MNVEIGAEAAQFPEKQYLNVIAVAVWAYGTLRSVSLKNLPLDCRLAYRCIILYVMCTGSE